MRIRTFKTYKFNVDLEYFSINFLPTIIYERFSRGGNYLFIGWLIWGLRIKW